jgi:hypothetical protein
MMQLVEEARDLGWNTYMGKPTIRCTVFEDNSGALEMARLPKMRPRTKHLCVRLHHFRERVRKGVITIQHVASELQLADVLTKPQPEALFLAQRESILQWAAEFEDMNHLRACGIMPNKTVVDGQHDSMTSQSQRTPDDPKFKPAELQHQKPTHTTAPNGLTTDITCKAPLQAPENDCQNMQEVSTADSLQNHTHVQIRTHLQCQRLPEPYVQVQVPGGAKHVKSYASRYKSGDLGKIAKDSQFNDK